MRKEKKNDDDDGRNKLLHVAQFSILVGSVSISIADCGVYSAV